MMTFKFAFLSNVRHRRRHPFLCALLARIISAASATPVNYLWLIVGIVAVVSLLGAGYALAVLAPDVHGEAAEGDITGRGRDALHFVWVSDCSDYQEWQSLVLLRSIYKFHGQFAAVTRLISGCDERLKAERQRVQALVFPASARPVQPKIFFTDAHVRNEELNDTYPPYNRPHSLLKWVGERRLRPSTWVVLLDPDMVMLAPLRLPSAATSPHDLLYAGRAPLDTALGYPAIGQRYGYMAARWHDAALNLTDICDPQADWCRGLTGEEVTEHFAVGPPWIMRFSDLCRAAPLWAAYVPRIRKQYRQLIAEMYAYSLAFASIGIRHLVVDHYVVSYPNAPRGEHAWPWVDEAIGAGHNPCGAAGRATDLQIRGPTFLHYCEIYHAEAWYFRKRDVPHREILSCKAPLFAEPSPSLLDRRRADLASGDSDDEYARRNARQAWFLCSLLPALNGALMDIRAAICPGGVYNDNRSLRVEAPGSFYQALRGFFDGG